MGCLQSKREFSDLHPNVFRVVNIDENGADLCTGQLEVTEADIILYREGRETTVWPLHSLRRYGFEGEIFSFESGRRCETGEGIYAFRCRRATLLFQTLQQQIQLRNVVHDTVPYPVSRITPTLQGRQTLQASIVHRSSIDGGLPVNLGQGFNNNASNTHIHSGVLPTISQSPRLPTSVDILDVMPLYPQSQTGNHVTNVYQVRDFKREHNNNQADIVTDNRHVYTNDFNRDLAMLRNTLRQETALNEIRDREEDTHFFEKRYMNENIQSNTAENNGLSPTKSNSSEHYAQLSIEQPHKEPARLYVNIVPNDTTTVEGNINYPIPTTPLTPKIVEYCNLTLGPKPEINTYANLMLGDIVESAQHTKQKISNSEYNQKFSESDTLPSMSPVEDINYAILDIDTNKDNFKTVASTESHMHSSSKNESTMSHSSQHRHKLSSQSSTDTSTAANTIAPSASIGYTTIDFEKTVALTSVAAGAEVENMEGFRKNRHNSCGGVFGSPSTAEKSRGNN